MDAREALKRFRRCEVRMEALLERRQRYAALANCMTPGRASRLESLQRELDERVEDYAALAADVERRIDALEDDLQREVLRYRYMNGWSWREIARRLGMSEDWLKHVHARAVEAL